MPDVSYFRSPVTEADERGYPVVPPTLAAEVRWPGQGRRELESQLRFLLEQA
ncbi:MAG: hypothetical protein ACM3S1_07065 [Hyphomicrobiales bacterium]